MSAYAASSIVALVLAGLSAGCVGNVSPETDHVHPHDLMKGLFEMDTAFCEEGGFVALYPMEGERKRANVWELVDVRDEVGKPLRDGYGRPLRQPAYANWHQGFRCESAQLPNHTEKDYIFGYVGNWIKAPAWDPGGADVHILLAGLGFGNGTIADTLRSTSNAAISHAYRPTQVTWFVPKEQPRSAVHAIYSDVEKGIYTSYSTMGKYRDVAPRTLRFWWQVPADGSQAHAGHSHGGSEALAANETKAWHPIYWDLVTTGGAQYTTPPIDSPEVACHMGTPDHGPQGGACQPTLTNVYHHKSLRFTTGHVIKDVTLTEIWEH